MKEIWKNIPGEKHYQVSNKGRVKSLARYVRCSPNKKGYRLVKERILRPGKHGKCGHVSVVLGKGTNGRLVHKLVLLTFVGKCPAGKESLHKNGIGGDNELHNLHYGTRSRNNKDMVFHGKRKVSVADVLDIRKRRLAGETLKSIADTYKICVSHAHSIANKVHYAHV